MIPWKTHVSQARADPVLASCALIRTFTDTRASAEAAPPAAAAPGLSRRAALALVALLAVPFTVLGVLQARADGPNWDEPIYLAAGLTTLAHGEIRINFEHPPLPKVLAAAPAALLGRPEVPAGAAWRSGDQWTAAAEFIDAQQAAGTLQRVVILGRIVPLAMGVATGFLLYALAASLSTRLAGVTAAGLWFTSPLALGLSHMQTIDQPFALATLVTALALLRAVRRYRWADVALVGLACGAALLTRHTGLLLTAAAGASVFLAGHRAGWGRALVRAAAVGVIAWLCVWAGYRALAPSPAPLPAETELPIVVQDGEQEPPALARLVTVVPWPEEYDLGIGYLARVSSPPAPGYVFGVPTEGASPLSWPAVMLVKLTPGLLLVLVAGLALVRRAPARREILLAVLLPAAVLALFTVVQPRPLGLRYLLASICLALAVSAGVVERLRGRAGKVALGALALTQVVALASAHPHSLAWTNPLFRPAYRYVSDSNVDWSQDFPRLVEWARGRRPWIAYAGPKGYGWEDIPGARPLLDPALDPSQVTGDVAVFAASLTAYHRDRLAWLRGYCPVGTIGGSILLYHLDGPPDLRPGPDRPAPPCDGDVSVRVDRTVRNANARSEGSSAGEAAHAARRAADAAMMAR